MNKKSQMLLYTKPLKLKFGVRPPKPPKPPKPGVKSASGQAIKLSK